MCVKSVHRVKNGSLYYAHSTRVDVLTTITYCHILGAQVPYDLTRADFPFMADIKKEMGGWGIWLNITIEGGRYRWGISGAEVAHELWSPGQPDCTSRCGVEFWSGDTGTGLATTCDKRHPFCMFDLTNDDNLEILQTRLASIDPNERASIDWIIKKSLIKNQINRLENPIISDLTSQITELRSSMNDMRIQLEKLNDTVDENHRTLAGEIRALTNEGIKMDVKVTELSNRVDEKKRDDLDIVRKTASNFDAVDVKKYRIMQRHSRRCDIPFP